MPDGMAIPLGATERTTLIVPGPELAPRMAAYLVRNREHVAATAPARPATFYEQPTLEQRFRTGQDDFRAGRALPILLLRRGDEDGPILGDITFSNLVRGPFLACYLGYNLDREHVGQGLMYEALGAAIQHVFEQLRVHRIMANYMPANQRSGRLLRRLGFTVEGYARDYLFLAGAWQDHILTSLTNPAPIVPG
jgi:[ribosomal protein S5]-alanine N-acetyltransferase